MPVLKIASVSLHVQSLGEPSTDCPPAILLHGLLVGSLAMWYFTTAPVLARSGRVVLYDQRGHGRSERIPRGYDLSTLSQDLGALRAELNLKGPVDLVGHSYGGLVALYHCLAKPESVRRLVLVDVPLPGAGVERLSGMELAAEAKPGDLMESLPAPVRDTLAGGGRRARRFLDGLTWLVHSSSLMADLKAEPTLQLEGRAAPPTLCIYGEDSPCLDDGRRLAAILPQAQLKLLPGGHFLPVENSHEVTQEVEGFLRG